MAVGEVLRRLTAKALCAEVKEAAQNFFWPAQVGVGSPLGSETAIHVARRWAERETRSSSKALLKLDFRNAFNLVSRGPMLQEVDKHFPTLSRWARWCYEQPSNLCFDGFNEQGFACFSNPTDEHRNGLKFEHVHMPVCVSPGDRGGLPPDEIAV